MAGRVLFEPRPGVPDVWEGESPVKIAFTALAGDLDAPLDLRFGRAPGFLVYDLESGAVEVLDNSENREAAQGAGIRSAELVARTGAKMLVTGHCGPKAFRVLAAAGIRIYNTDARTVAEALERYRKGDLKEASSANVNGHWI